MSEPSQPSTTSASQSVPAQTYEDQLPNWRRSVNRFAENWIFAFIVAMTIRHFGVEAFRIPTVSMEPTLYGEPAFLRSDHVLVDKLTVRFRPVRRWEVTVFQFPQPEVENHGEALSALRHDDSRRDNLLTRPLMYRNFVKRAVVLPGDVFYIAHGDLFVKQASGGFAIARRPAKTQESMWQEIYRHGAQPGYVPWAQGATTLAAGDPLVIAPGGGDIAFTQPLRNLYLKPGTVRVQQGRSGVPEQVDVSMIQPVFSLADGRKGNLWDLDRWTVTRLTTADIDKPTGRGRGELNDSMKEYVGDLRVRVEVAKLDGPVSLRLREGTAQAIELAMTPGGWTLSVTTPEGGGERASGSGSLAGHSFSVANIDDQVVLLVDGIEKHRSEVAAIDPGDMRSSISWSGSGSIALTSLAIDRDVHYCANGFLADETMSLRQAQAEIAQIERSGTGDALDAKTNERRNLLGVREQMAKGGPQRLAELSRRGGAIGFSAETAITAPTDGYLLLGDNSPLSWDGRNWGWVPAANLRGRVLCRARTRWLGSLALPFGDWSVVR